MVKRECLARRGEREKRRVATEYRIAIYPGKVITMLLEGLACGQKRAVDQDVIHHRLTCLGTYRQ